MIPVFNNINNLNKSIYIINIMEKLALTCKVLYDKDWLDNIKLCKDGQLKPIIKYESIHDWMKKMNIFQMNLKKFLDQQLSDSDTFHELKENLDWLNDDHVFIKNFLNFMNESCLNMTEHKYKYWSLDNARVATSAVKGALKGYYYSTQYIHHITKDKICNIIISMIFSMFGTQDSYPGIFDKISYMKCFLCKKFKNEVVTLGVNGEEICLECCKHKV